MIEKLEEIRLTSQTRDPVVLKKIVDKINEIIEAMEKSSRKRKNEGEDV